jgi:hypothetical protein
LQDLIAYELIETVPKLEIGECTFGAGATCGSICLDRRFERVIRSRLRGLPESVLSTKRLATMVAHFDNRIKREYNPLDPTVTVDLEVPIPGVSDKPEIGLQDGYLQLTE